MSFSGSGCSCGRSSRDNLNHTDGEPRVVNYFPGPGGTTEKKFEKEAVLDFGPTLISTRKELHLHLANVGRGELAVHSITREGLDSAFSFTFEKTTVPIDQELEIPFVYQPTDEVASESTVTIQTDSGVLPDITVTLRGSGVRGQCGLDPAPAADGNITLDFGSVSKGDAFTISLAVHNGSNLDWSLSLSPIIGAMQGQFGFGGGLSPGAIVIPANSTTLVPIEFHPKQVGSAIALLSVIDPPFCGATSITLKGVGVQAAFHAEPNPLDFGYVNPGSQVIAKVKLVNIGNRDVTVTGIAVDPTATDFGLAAAPPASITVPKLNGSAELTLWFKPATLGPKSGVLFMASDDPTQPVFRVALKGWGGGANIDASPLTLDFGTVGVGTIQERRILISNIGTDTPGTTLDNLFLTAPADLVSTTSELTLPSWPPDGYTSQGLSAGQNADLRVKFAPLGPGQKSAQITVHSNDPDQPDVVVNVVANAAPMPDCSYSVVPPALRFGNVEPGRSVTLDFTIQNNNPNPADQCLISTLGFSRGTPPAYTLVNGPISSQLLAGGASLTVPVKFAPTGAAAGLLPGAVDFYISSKTTSQASVPLIGSAAQPCLMVAPSDLDFGVVQVNCNSRARTFTTYNICSSPVHITAIDVQAGLSTEFRVTQSPVLPYTVAVGSSVTFQATYRPIDVGTDTGSLAVQTQELAQPYIVTLKGEGATTAVQTDVFVQDAQPKVDVLFVVDDSCSMMDKQANLGANFASFISGAISQQVDYHIAVTTTDVNCTGSSECGRFVPLDGSRPRIITPLTPNAASLFAQNVNVGTSGSGTERGFQGAFLALSAPDITGWNANFLRSEANLAVIVVSDAEDQSPQTVNFYYNFFMNIKGFSRANMFTFSYIGALNAAGAPTGCTYDNSFPGLRYRDMVLRTAGVIDEICTQSWAPTLNKLGQVAFGYRTRFFLTNVPDPLFPIDVRINGVPYPATGTLGQTQWTYNAAANAIDFTPLSVPEPGRTLTVSYHVECF